jgi:hypothetical protein
MLAGMKLGSGEQRIGITEYIQATKTDYCRLVGTNKIVGLKRECGGGYISGSASQAA